MNRTGCSRRKPQRALSSLLTSSLAIALCLALAPAPGRALPLYAARAGRTCDNCHLTPNQWVNPKLSERKCSLSCQVCHVDPAGGGMRNAAGRFYERATLPAIATSPRPTADWDRDFLGLIGRHDHATTYTDSLPQGPATAAERFEARFAPHDLWGYGTPLGGASVYAPFQGRYGTLRADPAFRIGWDLRLATYIDQSTLVFPMQADVNTLVHPLEHVSFLVNVGARGQSGGFRDTRHDTHTPYFREAYMLLHEAPLCAYVKAGRFVPAFGLRLDDHTTQQRRAFELDASLPEIRVTGVEVGFAPNYPFASLSWFAGGSRYEAPPSWDLFDSPDGHGAALNLGWRAEGWSLGGSLLARRRPLQQGGDATSGAVFAAFNPWYFWKGLPLVLQAEFDYGSRIRDSGRKTHQIAVYQEIDWLAGNGVNFLLAQDWSDPDVEVRDDHAWRLSGGVQLTPFPGVAVDFRTRVLVPAEELSGTDFLVQLRLYN